jgi:hypothetical protein
MLLPRTRTAITLAAVAGGCLIGSACGGAQAGTDGPSSGNSGAIAATQASSSTTGAAATSDWVRQADAICSKALPDDSHSMVDHFDAAHVRRHGMAIVAAVSELDKLGPPPGADAADYQHMLTLYKTSAGRHALALQALAKGDYGVAAAQYSIGLYQADQADGLAVGFGASSCARFGMKD